MANYSPKTRALIYNVPQNSILTCPTHTQCFEVPHYKQGMGVRVIQYIDILADL